MARQLSAALSHCMQADTLQQRVVASDPENAIGRENLAVSYVLTARVHRALSQQGAPEARRHYREEARAWYARGLAELEALRTDGASFAWTIDPDSLRAERATLDRLPKSDADPR